MGGEWEWKKIDEIAVVNSGKRLPKGDVLTDEPTLYPYIRLVDVKDGLITKADMKYLSAETQKKISRYVVHADDVGLAIVGHTIGMVFHVSSKFHGFNLTENAARITALNENVVPKYIYYYLTSELGQSELNARTVGSAQGKLPLYNIKAMSIPVPPRYIQTSIVCILGTLDDKIELNRQTNETLEAMAQALFKSWFVDFDPVIDNALAAGNDIPEPFKVRAAARQALGDARKPLPEEIRREFPDGFEFRDEMGWVPRGWETCKLSEILELSYGKSLPARDRLDGPYPVYGSGGISGFHSEHLVEGPGIVVGRKGTVGSIYWVDENFYPIDTVFYVKAFELVPLSFVYRSLLRIDIKSMGADSAVPGVNRNALYSAQVVRAPKKIVVEFDNKAKSVWTSQNLRVRQSLTLSKLRDTLLPKLLSGQLSIPDAEKLVADAT